jgi:DNA-binding NarL/FixJ family response regulator
LVVDDHEVVRVGLRAVIGRDPAIRIVGNAGTSARAVSEAVRLKPDVALLDIQLPDGNGIELCREILRLSPGTRVLFLTSYADDDTVVAAIIAGAHGYLLKEIGSEELIRSIKVVARGQTVLDPMVNRNAAALFEKDQCL